MDRIVRLIAIVILCISSVTILKSWADTQTSYVNENSKSIVVEIDYRDIRPSRTAKIPRVNGKTALEVLQAAAKVKTHLVGQYIFVVSIDGVEGKRGEMAWYYTVNGKSADKLAYSNTLNDNVNHIGWIYKKDVCSMEVDGEINSREEGGD